MYIGLYVESKALKWWKANRHKYGIWKEVKYAIREYYGDYSKLDRAFDKISDLKQKVNVQKYLNKINRLNVYPKITNHLLINIS